MLQASFLCIVLAFRPCGLLGLGYPGLALMHTCPVLCNATEVEDLLPVRLELEVVAPRSAKFVIQHVDRDHLLDTFSGSEHLNLCPRHGIEKWRYGGKEGGQEPWHVDDDGQAKPFGVVVLQDGEHLELGGEAGLRCFGGFVVVDYETDLVLIWRAEVCRKAEAG